MNMDYVFDIAKKAIFEDEEAEHLASLDFTRISEIDRNNHRTITKNTIIKGNKRVVFERSVVTQNEIYEFKINTLLNEEKTIYTRKENGVVVYNDDFKSVNLPDKEVWEKRRTEIMYINEDNDYYLYRNIITSNTEKEKIYLTAKINNYKCDINIDPLSDTRKLNLRFIDIYKREQSIVLSEENCDDINNIYEIVNRIICNGYSDNTADEIYTTVRDIYNNISFEEFKRNTIDMQIGSFCMWVELKKSNIICIQYLSSDKYIHNNECLIYENIYYRVSDKTYNKLKELI